MPFELIREDIDFYNKKGDETSQLLLEGDIIVPDSKPDIQKILRAGGAVAIDEVKTTDGRVGFSGELKCNLIYQAKKSDRAVYSMPFSLPIEDFLNVEGAEKDDLVTLHTNLEHMDCRLINDRKVSVRAVVTVSVELMQRKSYSVVQDVEADDRIQLKRGKIAVNRIVENKKDRFNVKEELSVPSGKPNILDVMECDISISDKELRAMDGKVLVKGTLMISTIYVGDTDDSTVETLEHEVPFSGFIEMDEAKDGMITQGTLEIDEQHVHVIPNDDGEERTIDFDTTLKADIIVSQNEEQELLEDAYSPGEKMEIARQEMVYPEFICRNKNKSSVKETITIDGQYADMMQVSKIWGSVALDQVELTEDLLKAEGVVHLEIMYIAKNDEEPVEVVPVSIPFEQEIEVKGAKEDMSVDITATIDTISFSMLSPREVEVRITLSFDVFVTKEVNGQIVTEMLCFDNGEEEFENVASAVIYVVQKGDTLWEIAKRYNTTVEDLVLVNELESPDRIYPGEKLLVLKKIYN